MALVLTSGPALEPVTVAEAKAHMRVDAGVEDLLIASLILTSRLHVEAALGLALITQHWSYLLDIWPSAKQFELPLRPVRSVDAVKVFAADDTPTPIDPSHYILDGTSLMPRLIRSGAAPFPAPGKSALGIEIALTAGYGDQPADVPAPIRQAILLLTAHWYEHRSPVEIGSPAAEVPAMVHDLLAPYRPVRL